MLYIITTYFNIIALILSIILLSFVLKIFCEIKQIICEKKFAKNHEFCNNFVGKIIV